MSDSPMPENIRSYGCTFGCGNPYDFIIVTVADSSTELLCTPCFIKVAADMVTAITSPQDLSVLAAMQDAAASNQEHVPGPTAKHGRRNAPATNESAAVFEAYDETAEFNAETGEFTSELPGRHHRLAGDRKHSSLAR